MRVSPTDYKDATRMAAAITFVLYGAAGMLLGLSTRRLELGGALYVLAMLGVIIFGNTIIWFFRKTRLPRAEAELQAAIAKRDGPAFARLIVRREATRLIQPIGGIALTLGFAAELAALHLWP
jgi:predicted metal-dependent RNase